MSGLDGYLNDHLAGSAAALQLVERLRARDPESELGYVLEALLGEIQEDQAVLDGVLATLGGTANPAKRAGALGVEVLANLRTSLPVVGAGSGEAARLEELEVLSLGIEGKRLLWKVLRELSGEDGRLGGFDFSGLERRAEAQRERLERFRLQLAAAAFKSLRAHLSDEAARPVRRPTRHPDVLGRTIIADRSHVVFRAGLGKVRKDTDDAR